MASYTKRPGFPRELLVGGFEADGSFFIQGDSFRIEADKTPASASDTGVTGQIAWDDNYIYVCVATDTWKRAAISTW